MVAAVAAVNEVVPFASHAAIIPLAAKEEIRELGAIEDVVAVQPVEGDAADAAGVWRRSRCCLLRRSAWPSERAQHVAAEAGQGVIAARNLHVPRFGQLVRPWSAIHGVVPQAAG